jgi:hypothetical protein
LFLSLYCGSIALQTALHYREQLQFFRTQPARIYGPAPLLLGLIRLPSGANEALFAFAGAGFISTLAAAACGFVPRLMLAAALICFLIYFAPILPLGYIQRKVNLIPIVLTVLMVAPGRTIPLVKIAIAMVYLSGALEKLRNAGIRWMDGRSLQGRLIEHYLYTQRPQALWLARRSGLCRTLSVLVLVWELSFWLVIVFPPLAWIYVPAGLAFHAGTAVAMRIHYWIYFCPAYFVFAAPWLSTRI